MSYFCSFYHFGILKISSLKWLTVCWFKHVILSQCYKNPVPFFFLLSLYFSYVNTTYYFAETYVSSTISIMSPFLKDMSPNSDPWYVYKATTIWPFMLRIEGIITPVCGWRLAEDIWAGELEAPFEFCWTEAEPPRLCKPLLRPLRSVRILSAPPPLVGSGL